MTVFIKSTILALSVILLLGVSAGTVSADPRGAPGYTTSDNGSGGFTTGVGPSVELVNVAKVGTIQDLLVAILRIVMILMVPIIVFFIILAGFKYATAGGNASQVEEASRALLYAIIGGVLILGAVAISEIIKNVVLQF